MDNWQGPPLDDEDSALGAPVAELLALRDVPREGFLTRIRSGINRRITVAEVVDFSLTGFFQSFMDYLTMLLQSLGGGGIKNPNDKDE